MSDNERSLLPMLKDFMQGANPCPQFLKRKVEYMNLFKERMKDLISREQALKALEEISYALWEVDIPSPTVPEYIEHHRDVQKVMGIADMWARKIMALPSTEKTGKWTDRGSLSCRCSECGCKSPKEYRYCPYCGARMVM